MPLNQVDFVGDAQFGLVVCQSRDVLSYYPKAFYWSQHGPCAFDHVVTLQSLDGSYSDALKIMGKRRRP